MIYLDNGATSFPKPKPVEDGIKKWFKTGFGSPGRGKYGPAQGAGQRVVDIRSRLAQFLGVKDPWRLIFTYGATDGLNMSIKGFLRQGDHVIITSMEHNSVLRPLKHLEREEKISLSIAPCDEKGYLILSKLWELFTDKTRLVVINHGSNVTGAVQPIAKLGAKIRKKGAYLLVDGAQTAGILPVDLDQSQIDFFACSGHKGLLGLPGIGVLAIGERVKELKPFRQGGTGFNSQSEYMPLNWPEAFEAGTLNMPGIISLEKALDFIESEGLLKIFNKGREQINALWGDMLSIPNLKLYGPLPGEEKIPIISFNLKGWEPEDLAQLLQYNYQIQLRAGLHCAPLAHQTIDTYPKGTVRVSPGYFTTDKDIEKFLYALKNISKTQVDWLFD